MSKKTSSPLDWAELKTTKQITELAQVSRRTVCRWVEEGRLHPYKFGRGLRFDVRELEGLLRRSS